MLALPAGIAEAGDRRRRVAPQPVGEVRIAPGLGDDMRAVARADLRLVGLDDRVDRRRVDQPLLASARVSSAFTRACMSEKWLS